MKFTAEYPWVLLLLPVLYGIVLFRVGKLRIGNRVGKGMVVAVRLLILTLLTVALAGVSVSRISDSTTTIFLIDASESFSGKRSQAVKQVRDAIQEKPSKDRVGVVAFGGESSVEQFVSETTNFVDLETVPLETETNMEQGIQTALSLFPEGDGKRLVLITDGRENSGDVSRTIGSLQAEKVEVVVMRQDSTPEKEVYLADMSVPESISPGETFTVEVQVESTVNTGAVLQLYNDSKLRRQENVTLQKGTNRYTFQDTRDKEGFANYRAVIVPDEDTIQTNNEFVAYTKATEQKKVLLVEGKEKESREFRKLLQAAGVSLEVVSPGLAPDTIEKMNAYSTILLENVYIDDLSNGFLEHVESYVKDYAGGLIAIGGDQSFALGGYRDSVLETVLPVEMTLKGEQELPQLAMAMVIDHSGSMSENAGGKTRLQLAKEAAVAGVENLRDTDLVGVESFDDTFSWPVKFQELADRDSVHGKIFGIREGGGTSIFPAVKAAYDKIMETDAQLKHIILLTDGEDEFRGYDTLIKNLNDNNVTLSTVSVGTGSDKQLLEQLATRGKGRFYQTDSGEELSRIFAQEVFLSEGEYLINKDFTPVISANHDVLTGVGDSGFPELKGYVGTSVKDTATTVLKDGEKEQPVVALWQYGLGTTAVFTPDVVNEWTANYASWEEYPVLWRNLISQTISDDTSQGISVSAVQEGNTGVIRYENKELQADDKVTAVYEDAEGRSQETELHSVSGTAFEGTIPLSQIGVYNINVRHSNGEDVLDFMNVQLTMQYSSEYRYDDTNVAVEELVAETTGKQVDRLKGCFDSKPDTNRATQDMTLGFLAASIVLWLFDVLNRRLPWFTEGVFGKWLAGKKSAGSEPISKAEEKSAEEVPVSMAEKKKRQKTKKKPSTEGQQLLDVGGLLKKQEERNKW